jgi:hypothetical protein
VNAPAAPTSGETGWGFAYYLNRHIAAADRVTIGTFYLYNYLEGLYRSADSGTAWTLVHSGEITPWSSYNAELKTVPGRAGHLFFTGGPQGGGGSPHPASEPFMRSTDGGVTWTAVPNVLEVWAFGFGAPAASGGYPSIYIVGWTNNQYGIWRSDDQGQDWTLLCTWPIGSLDQIKTISGDMNTYGTVYVGFSGSGYAYGTLSTSALGPRIANPSQNQTGLVISPTLAGTQIKIVYTIANGGRVSVNVYDSRGNLVKNLAQEEQIAGIHSIVWNRCDRYSSRVANGEYYCEVIAGKNTSTRKFIVMQ